MTFAENLVDGYPVLFEALSHLPVSESSQTILLPISLSLSFYYRPKSLLEKERSESKRQQKSLQDIGFFNLESLQKISF
jgi:hypothetical protein